MTQQTSTARNDGMLLSPAAVSSLSTIGLSIFGAVGLGILTMDVPDGDALLWVPIVYFVATLIGLVAIPSGFAILSRLYAQRDDPARVWTSTALALLVGLPVTLALGGLLGGPGLAAAFAANSLSTSLGLLRCPRPSSARSWPRFALVWGSAASLAAAAVWTGLAAASATAGA